MQMTEDWTFLSEVTQEHKFSRSWMKHTGKSFRDSKVGGNIFLRIQETEIEKGRYEKRESIPGIINSLVQQCVE